MVFLDKHQRLTWLAQQSRPPPPARPEDSAPQTAAASQGPALPRATAAGDEAVRLIRLCD